MGWFAELQCAAADFPAAAALLAPSGVRLLIDHLAGVDLALGLDQPGFRSVLDAAAHRARGRQALGRVPPFPRVPSRTRTSTRSWRPCSPPSPPERASGGRTGRLSTRREARLSGHARLLDRWLPDARDRLAVLWETPSALFGFDKEDR